MAELTKIYNHQPSAGTPIWENFQALNADVTANAKLLTAIKGTEYNPYDGFVLSNGAKWRADPGWLAVTELQGGWRVVTLSIVVKLADFSASHGKTIVSFPSKYAPLHSTAVTMPSSGRTSARWNVTRTGTILVEQISDASDLNSDYWFPLNVTYVTKDH